MANIRRRIEKLERAGVPEKPLGKQSLRISLKEGERCDIALQRELEATGININDLGSITFMTYFDVDTERDLRNHPDWRILERLFHARRIWTIIVVKGKPPGRDP